MTARQIMELSSEEIIGFHDNLAPFRARRMDWRRLPVLVQRRSAWPAGDTEVRTYHVGAKKITHNLEERIDLWYNKVS